MNFRRHTINDINNNRFYQMPKFLFDGEMKTALSAEAKVLYALLRDRHELSLSNNWVDNNGFVYLIFTRAEMCDLIGCGKNKIIKLCDELKSIGLFEEIRQGVNKPNLIYLNYIDIANINANNDNIAQNSEVSKSNFRKFENQTTGGLKNKLQEVSKSNLNDTDNNNTDNNDTYVNHSFFPKGKTEKNETNDLQERETYLDIIKQNIAYAYLDLSKKYYITFIDNCIDIMLDAICSSAKTIRIAKEEMPTEVVKSRFLKLDSSHLEFVYDCINNNTTQVKNTKSYMLTALYNAPVTMDTYFTQLVNYHLSKP